MVLGIYLADGVDDDPLLVDDVGGPQGAFRHLPVHFLLAPGLVGFQDGEVSVRDEVEGQAVLGNETLVGGGAVPADPDDLVAQGEKTLVVVAQVACLGRATRGAVLRVEIEHQFLSREIREFH